ncbi:MAG TPA: HDOD domain-containing protein, partial [Myxococcota bacterium]
RHAFTHGFLTGLWAQEIARRQRGPVEEAFLCGLLHDVGTPLLLQAACDALPDARERRDDVLAIVDAGHAAAGAELCRRWGMQERIASALEFHHVSSSGGSGGDLLRDIVVLANATADACDDDLDDAALVEHVLAHPAAAALNLYDEDVVALLARKATLLATAGALH